MPINKRFWSLSPVQETIKPVVIVQRIAPMDDNEITSALRVGENTEWWRAIIQLIDQLRSEYPASAASAGGANNALGMARDLGAHEALTQLLAELERRRSSKA